MMRRLFVAVLAVTMLAGCGTSIKRQRSGYSFPDYQTDMGDRIALVDDEGRTTYFFRDPPHDKGIKIVRIDHKNQRVLLREQGQEYWLPFHRRK